ncbi:MAG: carbonic anhydrase, partial [Acidobacteriota bacterium]
MHGRLTYRALGFFLVALLAVQLWTPPVKAATTLTADAALTTLMKGNRGYVTGNLTRLISRSQPYVRRSLATGQSPYAVVIGCSDSRVPPEIIFDKGLGEIFTIRVAGNVVAPHELGSLEYALEHLGSPLIVVMGHERCGAVTAAVDAYPGPGSGNIGSLIDSIMPAVQTAMSAGWPGMTHADLVEASVNENVRLVVDNILTQSSVVSTLIAEGKVKIVGAKYDLDTGVVSL